MQINDQIYSNFKSKLDSSNHEEEIRLAWATLIESTLHIKGIHAEEDKRDMSFNNVTNNGNGDNSQNNKQALPQTGNTKNDAAVAGLGLAGLLAMLGLGVLKKKRN